MYHFDSWQFQILNSIKDIKDNVNIIVHCIHSIIKISAVIGR